MLRQFSTVEKLRGEARRLVARKKIDSVDVAHRLSKLAPRDQQAVARAFLERALVSKDVQAVITLKRAHPGLSIREAIRRVIESKDIRVYRIELHLPANDRRQTLRGKLEAKLGKECIIEYRVDGPFVSILITATGKKRLEALARRTAKTKRQFLVSLA
jgi:hypothetical protein